MSGIFVNPAGDFVFLNNRYKTAKFLGAIFSAAVVAGCSRGLDLSTPKSAAVEYGKATDEGNFDKARGSAITTAQSEKVLKNMVAFMHSMEELRKVSIEKFGPTGYKVIGENAAKTSSQQVEEAEIKINGDTATVTMKVPQLRPLSMKKVNNEWRVDLTTALPPGAKDADVARASELYSAMSKATDVVTEEIRSGKTKTIVDGQTGLKTKIQEALMGVVKSSQGAVPRNGSAGAGAPTSPSGAPPATK